MAFLLDVNVLIALTDPLHDHHRRATDWFEADAYRAWAACPLTENGFVRIVGQRNYPNFAGDAHAAREVLEKLCLLSGHQFWPDDLSLRDRTKFKHLPDSRQLTDCYLIGVAVARKGCLATLDRGMDASLVRGGSRALFLIP
ncbi:MAG: PIN domain-containing protein [Chthoniobacterales bacterium]|nr:PIN domain-containing protein [Chthoniobacterales bacterium]